MLGGGVGGNTGDKTIRIDHALQLRFAKTQTQYVLKFGLGNRAGVPAGAGIRPFGRACVQQSFPRWPRLANNCMRHLRFHIRTHAFVGWNGGEGHALAPGGSWRLLGAPCGSLWFWVVPGSSWWLLLLDSATALGYPRWGIRWGGHSAIWPRVCAAELSASTAASQHLHDKTIRIDYALQLRFAKSKCNMF